MFTNPKSFAFVRQIDSAAAFRPEFLLFVLFEIDRDDLFGDLPSHRGDRLMLRMIGVMIQRRAVRKLNDEAGVERSVERQNVQTDIEAFDI